MNRSVSFPAQRNFNSYMVRLKADLPELAFSQEYNFNSYMVRLKVDKVLEYEKTIKFQFLYGAIKRV